MKTTNKIAWLALENYRADKPVNHFMDKYRAGLVK